MNEITALINSIKPINASFIEDDKKIMIEFEEELVLYEEEMINDKLQQFKDTIEPKIYFIKVKNFNGYFWAYIKLL